MEKNSVEVVVISLVTATERRESMTATLKSSRFKWSYFDAHRSLDNPVLTYDPQASRRQHGRELTLPQIACYSSHFTVIEAFLKRGEADYLLILEDDLLFDTDFPVEGLCEYCGENQIDYMRLFGRNPTATAVLGFFVDRSIVRHRTSPTGTQAYLMSRRGAQIFTDEFRLVNTTIDLALDKFWVSNMPLYSIYPYPVIERFSPTSIPIPDEWEGLGPEDARAWKLNRVRDKLRKIGANYRLRVVDARMRKNAAAFRQVLQRSPPRG